MNIELFNTFFDSKYKKETFYYDLMTYIVNKYNLGFNIKSINDLEVLVEKGVVLLKEVSTYECGVPNIDINYGFSFTGEKVVEYPKTTFYKIQITKEEEENLVQIYKAKMSHKPVLIDKLIKKIKE